VRTSGDEAGSASPVGEYNWGGAGGTYMWMDPANVLFVVYMMQSPTQRVPYRAVLRDLVYGRSRGTAGRRGRSGPTAAHDRRSTATSSIRCVPSPCA